jgi:hypothetical protein
MMAAGSAPNNLEGGPVLVLVIMTEPDPFTTRFIAGLMTFVLLTALCLYRKHKWVSILFGLLAAAGPSITKTSRKRKPAGQQNKTPQRKRRKRK